MARRIFPHSILIVLLWCGATQVALSQEPGQATVQPQQPAAPAVDSPPEYILQRGDDLEIRVHNIGELAQGVRVRPDGRISLLLLDEIQAAGMTASQLATMLSNSYAKFYRTPRATVIVRSFSDQTVFVGGEVQTPKMLPLIGKLTLAGALMSAGGLKNTAKATEVVLLRDSGEGRALVSHVDVKRLLHGGGTDPELRPFDVVFVPKSRIAMVNQTIEQYVRQNLPLTIGFGLSYLLGQQSLFQ